MRAGHPARTTEDQGLGGGRGSTVGEVAGAFANGGTRGRPSLQYWLSGHWEQYPLSPQM
jgi:hypothetical protein